MFVGVRDFQFEKIKQQLQAVELMKCDWLK